jgi:hypothetical protein
MMRILSMLLLLTVAVTAHADPLHPHGGDGMWWHAPSGWLFPKTIAGLKRDGQPYSLDGSDDAGATYEGSTDAQPPVFVEIYAASSPAPGATLEGAMAATQRGVDGVERVLDAAPPSKLGVLPKASATCFTFVARPGRSNNGIAIAPIRLYFLKHDEWVVTVRATLRSADKASIAAADAFVRTLPWASLGTADGSH